MATWFTCSYHWATVVHSSVVAGGSCSESWISISSYLILNFLYFGSHYLLISSWSLNISLIILWSAVASTKSPCLVTFTLYSLVAMPGTKVHSHKPFPVSSSNVARSLVLARQLLYASPLASYFAQDWMTWAGQAQPSLHHWSAV